MGVDGGGVMILGEGRASCTGGVSDWGVSLPSGAILVVLQQHKAAYLQKLFNCES